MYLTGTQRKMYVLPKIVKTEAVLYDLGSFPFAELSVHC